MTVVTTIIGKSPPAPSPRAAANAHRDRRRLAWIGKLWRQGHDTAAIARIIGEHESFVWNRLDAARAA